MSALDHIERQVENLNKIATMVLSGKHVASTQCKYTLVGPEKLRSLFVLLEVYSTLRTR